MEVIVIIAIVLGIIYNYKRTAEKHERLLDDLRFNQSIALETTCSELFQQLDKFSMFIFVDKNEVIMKISQLFCESIEYSNQEIVGKNLANIMYEADYKKYSLDKNIQNFRLHTKNGEIKWFECEVFTQSNGFMISAVDVQPEFNISELLLNCLDTKVAAFDIDTDTSTEKCCQYHQYTRLCTNQIPYHVIYQRQEKVPSYSPMSSVRSD